MKVPNYIAYQMVVATAAIEDVVAAVDGAGEVCIEGIQHVAGKHVVAAAPKAYPCRR